MNIANLWNRRQPQFLRWAVIAGVLVGSGGLAYALPQPYLIYVLALPFLAAGALILLRWPPLGLLFLIAAGLLLKVYVPAVGLSAALLAALAGLWLVDMVARRRQITLAASPTIVPLLLFTAVAILAFIVGQFPWYPLLPAPMDAQLAGLGILILSFAAFLLAAHQIRSLRWLKAMTYLFIGIGAVLTLGGFFPGWQWRVQRLFHYSVIGGSLFWTWLTAMTLSQALFNRKLDWRWRLVMVISVAGIFYMRLYQGRSWSSGWIPAFVALAVIVWAGAPRIALPVTAVTGLGLLAFYDKLYRTLILVGDNQYSALTRLEAWRIIAEIVKVSPILGLGPSNYRFYTPLYSILGWHVQFSSHNNYVDIVAQTGLLGLICFLWFLWAVGRLGWRLRAKTPVGSFQRAYVIGCLGGLAGTIVAGMLGDWVLPFVYNIGIEGLRASTLAWLFLGGLVALERVDLQSD